MPFTTKALLLAAALLGLPGRFSGLRAEEKMKIAVMDLKAKSGIEADKVSSLTDLVCTVISELGEYDVIGRDDMQTMLEHISDKQLLECDDTKCLAQVGGALGVQRLLSGNIGMLGSTYLINLKLIDIDNATVLKRISKDFAGDEAGLIGKMRELTRLLFLPEGEVPPPQTAPAAAAPSQPSAPATAVPVSAEPAEKEKPAFSDLMGCELNVLNISFSAPSSKLLQEKAAPHFTIVGAVLKLKGFKYLQIKAGLTKPILSYQYNLPILFRNLSDPVGTFTRNGQILFNIEAQNVGIPVGLSLARRLGRRLSLGIDTGVDLLFIKGMGILQMPGFDASVIPNFYGDEDASFTPVFSTSLSGEFFIFSRLSLGLKAGFSFCAWEHGYVYDWVDKFINTAESQSSVKDWERIILGGRSFSGGLTYYFK